MIIEKLAVVACGCGLLLSAGCGDRDRFWDRTVGAAQVFGLSDAVAVADPEAEQVVLLTTGSDLSLTATAQPIQRGVRAVQVAPNRTKLFVLSGGDGDQRPPAGRTPQGPALEVVTSEGPPVRYPLSTPLTGLALDPLGEWAVLYADQSSTALVRNPNELLLVNLGRDPDVTNPQPHTLRSFGGQPRAFTFTDTLQLPGGPRRLLIVQTEQDVAIVDLLHPADPEITIQLTSGQDTRQLHPAGVAVSDGEPAATDDARIAIRLENDPTVIVAQLVPGDGRDFRPDLNLTDVGGVPSDVAFVRTDGGALSLAALVPGGSKAVLVNPTTGLTVDVALPAPYRRLSLVTGDGAPAAGATSVDVALLWDGGNLAGGARGDGTGVAFWQLGRTAGQPYRSVETVGVSDAVTSVISVQGEHPELKILGTRVASFFLLNLATRTSTPFVTSTEGINIVPSATGKRAWAFLPGSTGLSTVQLVDSLHPSPLPVDRPISAVFEIRAKSGSNEARSLVAWHQLGNMGATVYDAGADQAHAAERRNYVGLLLGARAGNREE